MSGAAALVRIGITLNATTYVAPVAISGNTNATSFGTIVLYIPPYDATYGAGIGVVVDPAETFALHMSLSGALRPNAAITTILITASVVNALNTVGIKNVMIYAVAGS